MSKHSPPHPTVRRSHRRAAAVGGAVLAFAAVAGTPHVLATVIPGTPGNDVSVGRDNDNAANTFIQPPGTAAQQHLNNTDVLFGRLGNDLLVGRAGSDVLLGGPGNDILVGGPEGGRRSGRDVLLGDEGDDIAVWTPGDGSGTYVGDVGTDVSVVGRLLRAADGSPKLRTYAGRKVPRVDLDGESTYRCALVRVPPSQQLGEQFLLRILLRGRLLATVRLKDVEQVACPSPRAGYGRVADLTRPSPAFLDQRLADFPGVLGAIVAP